MPRLKPSTPAILRVNADVVQSASASDFNNDGISDFIKINEMDYCLIHEPDRPYDECAQPFETPHLNGSNNVGSIWMESYDDSGECRLPKVRDSQGKKIVPVTAWWLAPIWAPPFRRFFNSDRSMFFLPNQMVALRGNPQKQIELETPIVLYNPATDMQVGVVYALLPGCKFVPLDDLIWVTKTGKSLDMRKAFALADSAETGDSMQTMEWQVAILIRSMKMAAVGTSPDVSPEIKRDKLLELLKQEPLASELPDGWEAGLLYALNLPQTEWVRTKAPTKEDAACQKTIILP